MWHRHSCLCLPTLQNTVRHRQECLCHKIIQRLRRSLCRRFRSGTALWRQCSVINPQQESCQNACASYCPPHTGWLISNFAKVVNEFSAKQSSNQRANANGHESEAQIGTLLS